MLDPILNPWDACALMPILQEAGGHFFDWRGQSNLHGGSGISTNAALRNEVLSTLTE